MFSNNGSGADRSIGSVGAQTLIALLFLVALGAFELFNFDTTRFALTYFLGDMRFLGLSWAAILAFAFCSIDFAGLARIFTPAGTQADPREAWYLMGAWLLGATLNAIMTWWAVSLTLLSHELGNELLSRETLLLVVPVFLAVLVWLTRILFIGSISVAVDKVFMSDAAAAASQAAGRPITTPARNRPRPTPAATVTDDLPAFLRQSGRAEPRPASMRGEPGLRPGARRRAPIQAQPRRRR